MMQSLNPILRAKNYVVVENFIDPEYAAQLYETLKKAILAYPDGFNTRDSQAVGSPSVYNFLPFVDVLLDKCPDVSAVYGRRVYPTYTYSRLYKKEAELLKHVDRPSCEISVTLHLGSDGTEWPFYIKTPQGEEVEVLFKPGMGVVYFGVWPTALAKKRLSGSSVIRCGDAV